MAGYGLSVALAAAVLILSVSIARSDVGERIAQRAATAYYALPTERRERTVVFGESYIVAAYVDGYSKRYRLPEAHSRAAATGTSRRRPAMTRCSTSDVIPARCARTSPMCAGR